jgi:hypothetical protein
MPLLHLPQADGVRGDSLKSRGEALPEWAGDSAPLVDVTLVRAEPFRTVNTGERMAAALEQLTASQAVASIEDPRAWQREVRRDRPLPGKD